MTTFNRKEGEHLIFSTIQFILSVSEIARNVSMPTTSGAKKDLKSIIDSEYVT